MAGVTSGRRRWANSREALGGRMADPNVMAAIMMMRSKAGAGQAQAPANASVAPDVQAAIAAIRGGELP